MGSFVEHIKEKAKQTKKTILLPETMDDRTYYAAEQAMKEGKIQPPPKGKPGRPVGSKDSSPRVRRTKEQILEAQKIAGN